MPDGGTVTTNNPRDAAGADRRADVDVASDSEAIVLEIV